MANDYNHCYACEYGEQSPAGSWASRVGFFDERDFSAFVDFAPRSHAAREMRRLADELIHWRLRNTWK